MSGTDTRLRAFLAHLDMLEADKWRDAIAREVLRTAAIFGRFDAPTKTGRNERAVLVLHGIISVGATEDEVIRNWTGFARARFKPTEIEDDGFVPIRPDMPGGQP